MKNKNNLLTCSAGGIDLYGSRNHQSKKRSVPLSTVALTTIIWSARIILGDSDSTLTPVMGSATIAISESSLHDTWLETLILTVCSPILSYKCPNWYSYFPAVMSPAGINSLGLVLGSAISMVEEPPSPYNTVSVLSGPPVKTKVKLDGLPWTTGIVVRTTSLIGYWTRTFLVLVKMWRPLRAVTVIWYSPAEVNSWTNWKRQKIFYNTSQYK